MMKRFLAFLTLLMCVHAPVFGADQSDKYSDHAQNLRNWFVGKPDITSASGKTTFKWDSSRRTGLNAILGTLDGVSGGVEAFNAQLVKELCAGADGTVSRTGSNNSFIVECHKPGLSANDNMTPVFRKAHCAGFCASHGGVRSFGGNDPNYSCVCKDDKTTGSENRTSATSTGSNTAQQEAQQEAEKVAKVLITSNCFGRGRVTCTAGQAKLDCPVFIDFEVAMDEVKKFQCRDIEGFAFEWKADVTASLAGLTPEGRAKNLMAGLCHEYGRVSCVEANGKTSVSIECRDYYKNHTIRCSMESARERLCANQRHGHVVYDSLKDAPQRDLNLANRVVPKIEPKPKEKAENLLRSVCHNGKGRVSCNGEELTLECVEFNSGLERLPGLNLKTRIEKDTGMICTNLDRNPWSHRTADAGDTLTKYVPGMEQAIHQDEDLSARVLGASNTPPETRAENLLRVACVGMIGRVTCEEGKLRLECAEFQPDWKGRPGVDNLMKNAQKGICTDPSSDVVIFNNAGDRNDLKVYGAPGTKPDDENNDGGESDGASHTVKGTVVSDENGEPVDAAHVVAVDEAGNPVGDGQSSNIGTTTNNNGEFEFKFPANVTHVQISSVGFVTRVFPVGEVPDEIRLKSGDESVADAVHSGNLKTGDPCNYYQVCNGQNNCLGAGIVSAAQWLVLDEVDPVCIPTQCTTAQYKLEGGGTAAATCVDQVGKTCKPTKQIDNAAAYEYVWDGSKLECVVKSCKDKYEPAADKKSCVLVGGTCQPKDKNATKGRIENKVCVATACKKGYRVDKGKCVPVDDKYSAEEIAALQDNYDKMKAKEQSTANKLIGAVGVGATGIGAMTAASALAEQRADADAERDMKAYLETMRCNYGTGMNIKGGDTGIELPGGNDLAQLHIEYALLVESLTEAKAALGLKPGIEAEATLDKAETGLYDNGATGKTGGAYFSIARALQDPQGTDATEWEAQKADAKKKLKTGAIIAGVGAAGSLIANVIANANGPKNQVDKIKAEHDKRIRDAQAELNAKSRSQTTPAAAATDGTSSNPAGGQTDDSATGTAPAAAATDDTSEASQEAPDNGQKAAAGAATTGNDAVVTEPASDKADNEDNAAAAPADTGGADDTNPPPSGAYTAKSDFRIDRTETPVGYRAICDEMDYVFDEPDGEDWYCNSKFADLPQYVGMKDIDENSKISETIIKLAEMYLADKEPDLNWECSSTLIKSEYETSYEKRYIQCASANTDEDGDKNFVEFDLNGAKTLISDKKERAEGIVERVTDIVDEMLSCRSYSTRDYNGEYLFCEDGWEDGWELKEGRCEALEGYLKPFGLTVKYLNGYTDNDGDWVPDQECIINYNKLP